MGRQLTAVEYLKHWRDRKVWTHLAWPKHQARLFWCADQCVGASFADVGCALGHSTDIMRGRRPGRWTGIDFCQETVDGARLEFPDLVFRFAEGPAGLRTAGRFDSVVCSEVLEHVPADRVFFRALASISRRRVVITTPSARVRDPGHVRIYTAETLAKLLTGFRSTVTRDDNFFYATVETDVKAS